MRRTFLRMTFFLITGIILQYSCSREYGIVYKIFNSAFKSYTPLSLRPAPLDTNLLGAYILNNEIAVLIEQKDSVSCSVSFLPNYIGDEKKILPGFICDFKNRKYLNIKSPDYHYLFFRISYPKDSLVLDELTGKVNKLFNEKNILELIQKGTDLPDTVFYKLPLRKVKESIAVDFTRRQLLPQVRDIKSFYRFAAIFPNDPKLQEIKQTAIEKTLAGYTSVEKLQQLIIQYPELSTPAQKRAKSICYTTKNCIDFLRVYPDVLNKDSLVEKAFQFAGDDKDYTLLIDKFPHHRQTTRVMALLYFYLKKQNKMQSDNELSFENYSSNEVFSNVVEAIKTFNRIPFHEMKFNRYSYAITKPGREMLDRICYTLKETNRKKEVLHDVFVLVQCREFENKSSKADVINFRISVNRAIQLKKMLSAYKFNNLNFHFIPVGVGLDHRDSSRFTVRFTLNPLEAEKYKVRFIKQCFYFNGIVIPGLNKELITDFYLPEPELENYCFEFLKKKLEDDPKAQLYSIPCHFVDAQLADGNNEYQRVYARFYSLFLEGKLRKRNPEEFMFPAE